jgi:transposase InsO family protein
MGSQKPNCNQPWQFLTLDFLGPFPPSGKAQSTCLLVVTDVFTKFVLVQPFKRVTATSLINFVEQSIFLLFGVPQTILTDHGSQFTSKLFRSLLEHYGVTHWLTPYYHPQVNNSERVTAAIRATIKANHKTWADNIQNIANAIRNASHESTRFF